ncbi:hypothetical protein Pmar_PMAR016112 [Perkinsus marinus ATCC 50983]|uniref:PARP-type domain-containing protein n=1 Tax=Perkinsus marinus (strain ATCC 50983 / TXsc) TaxID=423536 RepID=C5LZ26_PERM5|nr:hypothetical protein Pmar_PMAR016112 [Perkinsus marinus ATCC 50983]EEQ98035.1 hypothetical protein Pmar_PMAR016112 [Perkinsus marinus ATCC 50983]|eukprot:XP_002765318.1 hypothetical protein Pmar_PMAR016112 [Perkinsus marinus ATCC 50983]
MTKLACCFRVRLFMARLEPAFTARWDDNHHCWALYELSGSQEGPNQWLCLVERPQHSQTRCSGCGRSILAFNHRIGHPIRDHYSGNGVRTIYHHEHCLPSTIFKALPKLGEACRARSRRTLILWLSAHMQGYNALEERERDRVADGFVASFAYESAAEAEERMRPLSKHSSSTARQGAVGCNGRMGREETRTAERRRGVKLGRRPHNVSSSILPPEVGATAPPKKIRISSPRPAGQSSAIGSAVASRDSAVSGQTRSSSEKRPAHENEPISSHPAEATVSPSVVIDLEADVASEPIQCLAECFSRAVKSESGGVAKVEEALDCGMAPFGVNGADKKSQPGMEINRVFSGGVRALPPENVVLAEARVTNPVAEAAGSDQATQTEENTVDIWGQDSRYILEPPCGREVRWSAGSWVAHPASEDRYPYYIRRGISPPPIARSIPGSHFQVGNGGWYTSGESDPRGSSRPSSYASRDLYGSRW